MPFKKQSSATGVELARQIFLEKALRRKHELRRGSVDNFGDWLPLATPAYTWDWTHLRYVQKYVDMVTNREIYNLMVFMPPRHGKLISDDTSVLTRNRGWTTHGDLKIGDWVYGVDGQPIKVITVFPKHVASLKVTTTDGAEIKTHSEHEWTVYDRWQQKWRTLETGDLLLSNYWQNGRSRFLLPTVAPIRGSAKAAFLVSPYALGVWLGDGSSTKGCVSHAASDTEHIDAVKAEFEFTVAHTHEITGVITSCFRGWYPKLRAIGVAGNKHIPEFYLHASVGQRLELLAGLIDTDGSVGKDGRVRFINANKNLVDGVVELVRSFGWRASVDTVAPRLSTSGIQGRQTMYYVGFTPTLEIPTKIPRKKIVKLDKALRRIGIKAIENIVPESGNCIQVDAADGLYLVGRHLVPTHNSEQITVRYPPYLLERDPRSRAVITSATATLAKKFARKSRAITRARGVVQLDRERQAVEDWMTTSGGGLRAIGVHGSIVGQGFDTLIMDDPVASREQVESPTERDKMWDWYTDDLYTRREPNASMILQVTRWHEDDLAGRILSSNLIGTDEEWVIISLPALCEGNDPDDYFNVTHKQREVGEALCPARRTREELLLIKDTMGSSFDALYQQRPAPEEGDIFKKDWFKHSRPSFPLNANKITQVWDTAMEKGERNDFSALVEGYMDKETGTIFVSAMDNTKYEFPELARAMQQHRNRQGGQTDLCVEDKANGKPARQQLRISGIPVIEIPAGTKDKIVRARSISNYCESGMIVFVNQNGNKNAELLAQLLTFPNAKNDDLVDAFVHLIRRLTGGAAKWTEADMSKFRSMLTANNPSDYD